MISDGNLTTWAGLALFGLGLALFAICSLRRNERANPWAYVLALLVTLWGFVLFYVLPRMEGVNLSFVLMGGALCAVLLLLGFSSLVFKPRRCSLETEGVYLGYESSTFYTPTPRFRVNYQGTDYVNTTGEVFRVKTLKREFTEGERYVVYINPDCPYEILTKRGSCLGDRNVILIVIGFLLLLFTLFSK